MNSGIGPVLIILAIAALIFLVGRAIYVVVLAGQ
jgi:hypothetical protein